ncbi:unnamed protein product [Dovyalis caffra]|uniref:Uncharacterized protein n=1 Tax=Dovyalis caffra TaxID=77055 RepID=A0AAV1R174_9ROSI|nr:unnamed protein product [Dovyalis caffra]
MQNLLAGSFSTASIFVSFRYDIEEGAPEMTQRERRGNQDLGVKMGKISEVEMSW